MLQRNNSMESHAKEQGCKKNEEEFKNTSKLHRSATISCTAEKCPFKRNAPTSLSLNITRARHHQLVRLNSSSFVPLNLEDYDRRRVSHSNQTPTATSIGSRISVQHADENLKGTKSNIDGGWAWVVMVASFCMIFMVDGVAFSFGVFLDVLTKEFGEDKTKTSLVGSVLNGFYLGMGPVASALAETFGYRIVGLSGTILTAGGILASSWSPNIDVMIVLYGVVGGTGICFMYLTSMVSTSLYFDKKRPLAVGIASCGSGVGIFVMPIIMQKLFDIISWRNCIRIQASFVLLCTLCSLAFRPLQQTGEKGSFKTHLVKMINVGLLKSPAFIIVLVMGFLSTIGISTPFIYIKNMAQSKGIDDHKATWLISMMGITNTVGRIVVGAVISRVRIPPLLLLAGGCIIGGILTMLSDLYTDFVSLSVYACLFGNVYALDATLSTEILARILGRDKLSGAFGLLCFVRGIAFAVAGPVAGSLFDATGDYSATFYLAGCAVIVTGILSIGVYMVTRNTQKSFELEWNCHEDPDCKIQTISESVTRTDPYCKIQKISESVTQTNPDCKIQTISKSVTQTDPDYEIQTISESITDTDPDLGESVTQTDR